MWSRASPHGLLIGLNDLIGLSNLNDVVFLRFRNSILS